MLKFALTSLIFMFACGPPPAENIYRKERRFPSNVNVPVALVAAEWGGKPRVMGSAWLIEGSRGIFDVKVDGKLVYSKHKTHKFPEAGEVARLIQSA